MVDELTFELSTTGIALEELIDFFVAEYLSTIIINTKIKSVINNGFFIKN
jgi:hypothetical protein